MKWYQRVAQSVKAAVTTWTGQGYNFSSWAGRTFFGIDNSSIATNETIFSVITRKANTLASLPIKLYQNYDIINNDVSDLLANSPNPNMTSFDFFNKMEVSRNETGNGYAIIFRDIRMQPEKLVPVDSKVVTPVINSDDGELWYRIRGQDGKDTFIHNMNMFHVKHITGISRLEGISPLKVLANTLKYDKAVQEFSLSEMEKKDSFTLAYAANVKPEIRQQVIDDFKRFYNENGGILFKEPGVEIDKIKKEYFASDTLASERITRSRVANVFNIPVTFLNDMEGHSFTSNEQVMIQYVQMGLTPDVRQYEQEANRKLLNPSQRKAGQYFKFNVGSLLRGDTTARTNFYQTMLRSGGMKPDEVRMLEDLPPVGGKAAELWISGDLYPIEMDPTLRKSPLKGGEGDGEEKAK